MRDYRKLIDNVESVVLALSIIGVLFLILQLGFIKDMEMPTFYEDYEGIIENESVKSIKKDDIGYIVLKRNSDELKNFKVKINGKGNYKFDKNNELMLKVKDGDIIEMDNTGNDKVILKVIGISKNIENPKLNDILTINESIKTFLEVKIK